MRIQYIPALHLTLSLNHALSVQSSNLTLHPVIDLTLLDLSCRIRFTALKMSTSKSRRMTLRPSSLIKVFTLRRASRSSHVSLLVSGVTTFHQQSTIRFQFVFWIKTVRNTCKLISGRQTFQYRHGSSKVQQPLLMTTTPATTTTAGTATWSGTTHQTPARTTIVESTSMPNSTPA